MMDFNEQPFAYIHILFCFTVLLIYSTIYDAIHERKMIITVPNINRWFVKCGFTASVFVSCIGEGANGETESPEIV